MEIHALKKERSRSYMINNTDVNGKCSPCLSKTGNLCCNQVISTAAFKIQQTKKAFQIFQKVNCKIQCVIYLMEYTLCNKHHVGKAETAINIRLNNHRKDVKDPNAIIACKHFQAVGHNFNKHAKFIIIFKLVNVNNTKYMLLI